MKVIYVPNVGEVSLRKSSRARRLILKVDQKGQAVVTLPNYIPYKIGEQYAVKHQAWFQKHLPPASPLLTQNKRIGREHYLVFEATDVESPVVRVSNARITVQYPFNLKSTDELVQITAQKGCLRALKKEADSYLPTKLHQLATQYGYRYRQVRIKTVYTRWGSCSKAGIINLSVWLMQLPEELIEYVLCHELTHLNQLHHQPDFWQELSRMVPNYKQRIQHLKQFSPRLI